MILRRSIWPAILAIGLFVGCSKSDDQGKGEVKKSSASTGAEMGSGAPKAAATGDQAIVDSLERALKYIRSQQSTKDGAVSVVPGNEETRNPAVTAMAMTALAKSPKPLSEDDKKAMTAAVQWIVSLQKADGSIFEKDLANYCTSAAVMMFAAIGDPAHKPVVEKALAYIQRTQRTEESGFKPGDKFYGGVGYEDDRQDLADLSNSSFGIEAAHAGGLPKDSKFFKIAPTFLARTQNNGETNDQVWTDEKEGEVRPGNDGGAIYRPGASKAGIEVLPDGRKVFRSYGSMSYALLKSYIFCGLDKRDPKVKAVAKWCADNFTVDVNPGFVVGEKKTEPYQGLFYYYMSMSKALRALGEPTITDSAGVKHDWKAELAAKLISMQQSDGSFVNPKNTRWDEASPVLCTCYAAITLQEILAAKK